MGFLINPYSFAAAGVGGWKELGRTTLGSAGDAITVSSLANKRYLMVLTNIINSGSYDHTLRLGSGTLDTGSNYSDRVQYDGGADVTAINQTSVFGYNNSNAYPSFEVDYISNYSSKEKLLIGHLNRGSPASAGYATGRTEHTGKWTNTSNVIDIISRFNSSAGDYSTGSEVVVLGWDPADTHTTNFWTELASVQGTASSQILSSGTITAKKYLWIQGFTGDNGGGHNSAIQFNNDTATNYATRRSLDGGADDSSWINQAYAQVGTNANCFFNYFIINNSANEKLCIGHIAQRSTAGAGTAPARGEFACKWTNTSAQITEIDLMQQSTTINWGTDVYMKVWGSN